MGETSGSCAVYRQPNVLDTLSENYHKRQLVKRELRKKELSQKGEDGALNTTEALELAGYKIEEGLEKIAALGDHTVCYVA